MDEIDNSGSYQPSSPVMESPLMQLANASISVMRASLPPKEMKDSAVETKSSPFPALHSVSSSANTDPHISLLNNSNIDSLERTHEPLEGIVSSINNPSPGKLTTKSGSTSLNFVGTETPVLGNITASQISKHGNFPLQITGANLEVTTQENHSHKEHKRFSLLPDGPKDNVTKSSVSRILTSNPSSFSASDMISAIAAGDAISRKTNNPKDSISQQISLQSMLPSQINITNLQTEKVPVKNSISKFTTCENEKNISFHSSELIPKTTVLQSLKSGPLTQKDTKVFTNPNPVSVCTVTQESYKDTNSSPQTKQLSNAGFDPVSNIICSLPSKIPLVLPVRPLLQLHTISQTSTTQSLLNKHSHLKESQNISENVAITSEIISSNTSVNVPKMHNSSVKQIPSLSQMAIPVKSCDNISPCTVAFGTNVSGKKTNLPGTNISSVKKDIASYSSLRAVQTQADVEIPSKLSFPVTSAKVVYCSSGVDTLACSKSSFAKNADSDSVNVCTVDSVVAFCTPTVITTSPAIASTVKCNPNSVTNTLSTSVTCSTTFCSSASAALSTHSVSTSNPIIGPHIVEGSLTTATPSVAPFPSLTSGIVPTAYATVQSTNVSNVTIPSGSTNSKYTSDNATSTLITTTSLTAITTSTSAITTCIPVTTAQSSKKLKPLQEYEITSNKSQVYVAKKHSFTRFEDENPSTNVTKSQIGMSHSHSQNAGQPKLCSLAPAMEPFHTTPIYSGTDCKPQDISVRTEALFTSVQTEAPSTIAVSEEPSSLAMSEAPSAIAGTKELSAIAGTKALSAIARTEVPSTITRTEAPSDITGTEAPSTITRTEAPSDITGTEAPSTITRTEAPSDITGTEAPSVIAETQVLSAAEGTETPSAVAGTQASSSELSSTPDESFSIVKKPSSDEIGSRCKSPIDLLSRDSLSRIEADKDSSIKQSSSTKITETAISNTASDLMTSVSSSLDETLSDRKSASASLIGTVVSVANENIKKNLTRKDNSNLSSPAVSDELVSSPKKPLKKSKPHPQKSKLHTVSKSCTSSNTTLPSVISKEESVSSDLNLSTSDPKSTSPKEDLATSSNDKNKSQISTMKTENTVDIKRSVPTKTEECSISTRPRRTIKARRLFSSSSYSTGSTDAAEESSSSSNKQRKKINTQSSDEEKKGTSSNAIRKPHTNKTVKDEETCSQVKKPARRRILPAIKTDSADSSKNCLLIKTSPNDAQVSSDTSLSPGYTYLLTALNLTSAEKDSGKIVKTPTMASHSGVTSTSPTYCNSKRNVTTECSTIKEQKSPDKNCTDSLISSSTESPSQKNQSISSPANYTDNTSDDSLEDATESDSLQNSVEIPVGRKRKYSTSDVNAASNSLSPKSCDELSQQIAEAEKFIKKEPVEDVEVDQTVIENNAEANSQNSSEVCAPTRVTREIRKLLNAGSNNNQVPLVQDLISPSQGNNLSQTRPLAPVQLGSPYAIFLPVSLASGSTTTVTTPATSAPLYSIQLNVPNVVKMGKPYLPNDGSIAKKHCTIVPAVTSPKTDNSSMKSNLISRNNLIATYYPAPLPETLMNKITVNYHACGECGDTFLFKSSLNAHKTRKCMQLTYNCDNCTMKLIFYNKCSVLEHIRSHYPTRPVTIKLDRMEVMPLPEGITNVIEMEDESGSSYRDPEEAAKFDCSECGAKFHSARALADHFGHSENVCSFTFYCALCQTYLPRHCSLLAHRRVHHEKPPHVCPECGLLISNLISFREHLKYKCMHFSRIAPLVCPKCMSKFCYTPELKEHIISVHSETFIKCSICPMAFKASASYQTHHQNTHASELEQKKEIYKCPLCDTVFHSIQQLMNHVDIHIGELKKDVNYAFRCSICYSIFAKRSQLISHLGSSHHLDCVQHRCEFCDCVCKTAHNLQTHQRAIHKVELKKFEFSKGSKMKGESASAKSKKMKIGDVTHCSLCHIFFATLAQLQMHTMKVHQKKTNDSTPDSGTSSSPAMTPISKNSQKFCRYCKAPYKSWSRLMQHILGHRNSGVYICLICTNAAFISKEELSKHEEFCSGENLHDKPPAVYECAECHQLFKQESWLVAHQKNIHPKKGAFTCDVCGLPYKSNSSLQKHIQTVHEGKRSLYCYVCKELNKEKIFRCQSQLEKHLMTKHKMSLNEMKLKQSDVEDKNDEDSSLPEKPGDKNKQASTKSQDVVPAKKAKLATTHEETYICAKCNFTCKNFDIFQLHIQEHKTCEDGIQCSTCGLSFAAVDSLRMHLFAVHKIKCSNDSLRDQEVNKSPVPKVLENSSLSTVVQSSVTDTPSTIDTSESTNNVTVESASKATKLVKHTSNTNSDSKSLSCQCNVCYKTFETELLLKVHMRTHGMAFIRSKRLTMSE